MYTFLALIVITTGIILFAGYKNQMRTGVKNNSTSMGIIKFMIEILQMILFNPIFDLFTSIFRCVLNVDSGIFFHEYYPDYVCFESYHILHMFFAAIGGALFCYITIYILAIKFE